MRVLLFWICLAGLAHAGPEAVAKVQSDHGVSLALSGMLIVFLGLTAISVFIGVLPKLLDRIQHREPRAVKPVTPTKPKSLDGLDAGTLTAIALVLHAEAERSSGQNLKVTLGLNPSPWALSSQMRVLPGRIKSS